MEQSSVEASQVTHGGGYNGSLGNNSAAGGNSAGAVVGGAPGGVPAGGVTPVGDTGDIVLAGFDSKKNQKKILWVIFGVIGAVVLVGVIIAVVLMVNNNKGSKGGDVVQSTVTSEEEISDEEAYDIYNATATEITAELAAREEQYDGGVMLELYKEKMDAAENIKVKALLAGDYYIMMQIVYPEEDKKDEIMNGLIDADNILKTARSAMMVVSGASWYNDEELVNKYTKIANERLSAAGEIEGEDEGTAG